MSDEPRGTEGRMVSICSTALGKRGVLMVRMVRARRRVSLARTESKDVCEMCFVGEAHKD